MRMSQIIATYPSMSTTVAKLMMQRPKRNHTPQVLYIWGKTGTGKTTAVDRVVHLVRELYNVDYYYKVGGLSKYFDGYDNQEIVIIDDPVKPQAQVNQDDVQMLKRVLSTGDTIVEVKFGNMVFDAYLVIITANLDPNELANACGIDCREAIFRRLTDTCGAINTDRLQDCRDRLPELLLRYIFRIMTHYKLGKYNDTDLDCYFSVKFCLQSKL